MKLVTFRTEELMEELKKLMDESKNRWRKQEHYLLIWTESSGRRLGKEEASLNI